MYSIVMMAAMTAAPETPDFFFNKGGGCHGCYGGGGCYGSGCYGSGAGYGGCHGSGWGCHGAVASSGCYGCNGGGCHGMFGGHGFCGFGFLGHKNGGGCHGCSGGAPYYTGCGGYAAPAVAPVTGGGVVVGYSSPSFSTIPATGVPEAVATLPANRAQVVVRVPADAKLFADGQATQLTGTERVFLTPDLSAGRDFQYTLKVEYSANGEAKSDTKQLVVRAGHRTVVEFAAPATEKATSSVTVTLPEKAKLFVDGVEAAAAGGKHTFQTPELPKGKAFVYEFRAEIDKDGKSETMSQKVTFNAGEPIVVDFTEATATRTALK